MDASEITPFRMSKPFEEHMVDVLDSLITDPNGLYQVTYRVGHLMVSAQVWRDPAWGFPQQPLTDYDREFLSNLRVSVEESPEQHATP